MPEKLKNIFFTRNSIRNLAELIKAEFNKFNIREFERLVFDKNWDRKELKAKMRHVSLSLHKVMPPDYSRTLKILKSIAPNVGGFEGMVLPDYVEVYGRDNFKDSMEALEYFTRYSSSEFAIRPFIDSQLNKVVPYLEKWAESPHDNVRRFASEGCRPRLPWAMALPELKKNPAPILPVLEKLKNDSSEFVRRSVANNLNDISKDNPELVLDLSEKWLGESEKTDWIVKHACRTLLKAGNPRALGLFGYSRSSFLEVKNFMLRQNEIKMGEDLDFSFVLIISGSGKIPARIEYQVDFVKSNRKVSSKVFKLSEKNFSPGEYTIRRKYSFIDMSTRKHFAGEHKIIIILNGEKKASKSFLVHKI